VPNQQSFKDLKVTFNPHPINGDLQVTKDEAAIKQSITNLLLTNPGERLFDSQIGSGISALLFGQLDFAVAGLVADEIKRTLSKYEPRISLEAIEVTPDFDNNAFEARIEFTIRGRQDTPSQEINFLLQRTR
jgi:hypothetical protein